MDERCKGRKCLKEINPEEFPGVYLGTPGKYDSQYGACHDCQPILSRERKVELNCAIQGNAVDQIVKEMVEKTIKQWGLGISETEKPKLLQRRR